MSYRRTRSCPPRSRSSETSSEPPEPRVLTVVLAQASLDLCVTLGVQNPSCRGRKKLELLSSDNHPELRRLRKSPTEARPDILHQCLLSLLDSPINKSGHLRVLIESTGGTIIKVNPRLRVPRTFKRFSGLMGQLLHVGVIYGAKDDDSEEESLLQALQGPVWKYISPSCYVVGMSQQGRAVKVTDYVQEVQELESLCVVVGAIAAGPDNFADEWIDEKVSISEYGLTASVACSRFTDAVEELWDIR